MPEYFSEDKQVADIETGEVSVYEKGGVYYSPEERKRRRQYAEKASNDDYESTALMRGSFYSILSKGDKLLPDLSDATLNKLIYLATYIDTHGRLCTDATWHKGGNSITPVQKPMTKEEIQEVLQVNRQTFSSFWKECVAKEMITEKDGCYYLPRSTFRFCETVRTDKKKTKIIKVFKHAIRYMYTSTDERTRKWLTHLYRLIPFINLSENVLCANPFESDTQKIEPLTLGQICDRLGIDRKNQTHLLRGLTKLKFVDMRGDVRSVIQYSWRYCNEDRFVVTINPQFYSGYITEENMVAMLDDFRIEEIDME